MIHKPEQRVEFIPLEQISVVNTRSRGKAKFKQIVANIGNIGLKKPITVARRETRDGQPHYDLVCGQGRLEAYRFHGETAVPAVVIEASKEELMLMSLVENLARRRHTSVELAKEILSLKERGYGFDEIARKTRDAIAVRTYAELDRYLAKFAAGDLDLVLLLGRHGTGKTESVKRALGLISDHPVPRQAPAHRASYIEGHAQPYGLYQHLWQHRDMPVVLDDLDRLYANPGCIRLLKPLCSARSPKHLSWVSNHTVGTLGVPETFETNSNVMLVANEWRSLNANVRALENRTIILHFAPSSEEVHGKVGEWFDDADVYAFVGMHVRQLPAVSMRYYEKGRCLRRAGFADWRVSLLRMMIPDPDVAAVAELRLDQEIQTELERLRRFMRERGRSRATYYRIKRKLST